MWELFLQDARRWVVPSQISTEPLTLRQVIVLLFRHLPLRAMFWFRLGSWCKQRGIPFLPGYIQRRIYRRYGLEIVVGADIGGGLYIAHPIGTVIAPQRIGRNCTIVAAVTIGMRNEWAFPIIGDEVFIGAGARVLGGITVGDRARIGANAVVTRDVPSGATVVGIPARVVKIDGTPTERERVTESVAG
ncbi:serine O-acetyltransferase [Chloroflexus aggregans]|uniref:Serine acetyltransferase n=1 Tax=Chloroflexus aggregans (strain MD-66 / DSM 9485) TaxID=326427 RepID=B8G376_CHLAD|nr:DapH/DapD/GlmU-related protein [Chloroflexus aggregans]ACL25249.1 serine acetyltransferase [Chloroflexus aggregans DSM 9485]